MRPALRSGGQGDPGPTFVRSETRTGWPTPLQRTSCSQGSHGPWTSGRTAWPPASPPPQGCGTVPRGQVSERRQRLCTGRGGRRWCPSGRGLCPLGRTRCGRPPRTGQVQDPEWAQSEGPLPGRVEPPPPACDSGPRRSGSQAPPWGRFPGSSLVLHHGRLAFPVWNQPAELGPVPTAPPALAAALSELPRTPSSLGAEGTHSRDLQPGSSLCGQRVLGLASTIREAGTRRGRGAGRSRRDPALPAPTVYPIPGSGYLAGCCIKGEMSSPTI